MQKRIKKYLTELVALDSISGTAKEAAPAKYVYDFLKGIEYFKNNPNNFEYHQIPEDPFGRAVTYGFLKGNSSETVVMMGHIDVVSAEPYGTFADMAFTLGEELESKIATLELDPLQREHMESGEWIWGRGAADMKGGIAIHMALLEDYAKQAMEGTLEGSIVFMVVPDEESYSAGMRDGVKILSKLKKEHSLNYKLLIDPEPTNLVEGNQIMSIGSVGKTMPVVMVQGVPAHIGYCFNGMNALDVLTGIYEKTNGSLDFSDIYEDEATVPPNWTNLRDMKDIYDVTLPKLASGYFTVLSFDKTPTEMMNQLKDIATKVFEEKVEKLNNTYQEFKKRNKFETKEKLHYEPIVWSFEELVEKMKAEHPGEFEEFYNGVYETAKAKIEDGSFNYPEGTQYMMKEVLGFANMLAPVVLIAFTPPYYSPVHADRIPGKEGYGTSAYEFVSKYSKENFQQDMNYENYFMGISDASYSGLCQKFDYEAFSRDTPLWGDLYSIDFESMEDIAIPAVIYGPMGLNYHQAAERVNKKSLFEIVPATTRELIKHMWEL
ncbi:MAG: M20/M25/M40 family metallo-hydrolase [Anaerovoracaceae bacterium]